MNGFKVSFKVFANSQEEADKVSKLMGQFIDNNAQKGIAVTATKLAEAIQKYGNNVFVNSYFKK